MKKKKLRPLGDVMFDVEDILTEMCIDHDLQHSEVLYLIKNSLDVHFPEQNMKKMAVHLK